MSTILEILDAREPDEDLHQLASIGIPAMIRVRDKGTALVIDGVRRAGPGGAKPTEEDEIPF
jgi:hypothetical protein